MFDFFKDTIKTTYLELNGIHVDENSKMIKKNRKGEYEEVTDDTIIIKRKTKIMLFVCGVLLALLNVLNILYSIGGDINIIRIVKSVVLLMLIIPTMVLLCLKNKQCEIASIILMVIIVLIYFLPI